MKYITTLFLVLITIISCKSDSKTSTMNSSISNIETEGVKPVSADKELSISFDLASTEGDTFQFQFTNNEFPDQSKKEYVVLKKSKKNITLEAKYSLESNEFPSKISIILGHNKPKELTINSITLKSYDNIIRMDGSEILDYFIPNSYIDLTPELKILKTIKIKNGHLPIMTLNKKAIDSLLY